MKRRRRTVMILAAAGLLWPAITPGSTRIAISTNVIRSHVDRLGINIGDTYWDGPTLKKRAEYNFEGLIYRQCHAGELYTNGFATYWGSTNLMKLYGWDDVYTNGASFSILSGEGQGITGRIVRIETKIVDLYGNGTWRDQPFFVFDTPVLIVTNGSRDTGLLVEDFSRTQQGYMGNTDGNYWKTPGTTVITNDRAPGSFGTACARLQAESNATIRMPSFHQRTGDANGNWHLRFWARRESGTPSLKAGAASYVSQQTVSLTDNWQQYDLTLTASGVPTPPYPSNDVHVIFHLASSGSGSVLLDDVEFWKDGQTNSTAFSDDALATLRKLDPGIIRFLRMGGSTVSNAIVPRLRQFGTVYGEYTSVGVYAGTEGNYRKDAISIHEQAGLCEELGAVPWFCLPGGLHPEEVSYFIDYLAGSTNTPGGKLRAELGHPQPWADVFDQIHIEFGNEAWNYASAYRLGGFNGSDYWKSLIAAGKSAASFKTNIIFQAAGQNFSTGMSSSILNQTTNADRYAIAPYMLHNIQTSDLAHFTSDHDLFQWMMAYPLFKVFDDGLPEQGLVMDSTGIEFSLYEYNYHTTDGDLLATIDTRNRFLTSVSHGVSIGNSMLAMLKSYNIRSQCFFTMSQFSFDDLRLWGNVISARSGKQRYRPAFLALEAANKVLRGNLIETVQSGDNPLFTAIGDFDSSSAIPKTYKEIYSYAFKDGATNGLIIANYNLSTNHSVEIALPEYVTGNTAAMWTLTAPSFTNSNEPELSSPQVTLEETTLTNFDNNVILDIPPASLVTLKWLSSGAIPQIITSTGSLYIAEGTITNIALVLSSEPAAPLTISCTITNQTGASFRILSGSTLGFDQQNWNLPQIVTLLVDEDAYGVDGSAVLQLSSPGYTTALISLNEIDDDPAGTNVLSGTLLFDFGSPGYVTTNTGWNNVTTLSTGLSVANAVNSDGTLSGYSLEITDAFQFALTDSGATTANYPYSARRDYFRVFSTDPSASIKLTGMSPSLNCTVSLLASGTQDFGSETRFTIGEISKVIDSYFNSTLLVFTNVAPSLAGELAVGIDIYGSGLGALNIMQVDYTEPYEPEDTDGDSLPDWWEDQQGYGSTGAVASAPAANGINSLLESYIAGLDPADARSKLLLHRIGPLQWNAVSGRVYTVYWSSNLLSGFQTLETNLTSGSFTDLLHGTSSEGFYKIEVKIAP